MANNNNENAELVLQKRKSVPVLESYISFLDTGKGEKTVVFLHGNPTSSYLWRNIIADIEPYARCIALDCIGMGKSGKDPNNSYQFRDHYRYFSAWMDLMNLPKEVHFVLHDWGSVLGFHWCNLHRDRVGSISYLESIIGPMTWDDFPELSVQTFKDIRSPKGEEMVIKQNIFVETLLPSAIIRKLSSDEMENYTAPYKEEKFRLPTLMWCREVPIKGEGPAENVEFTTNYNKWLSTSANVPKLYIHVEPGWLSPSIKTNVKDWPNNKVVTVKGIHFAQEDSPLEIAEAIKNFIPGL